jgi:glycosyltransferase involved in cell wall biosynthesis
MSRPLRIVVGITSRSWGGNETWAADAARALADRGHDVTVLWTHEPVRRELARRGLVARRVRLWGDLNPAGFAHLVALLRRERPDVLLLTKQREYWMGGLAARLAGRPLVVLRMGLRRKLRDDYKRRTTFGRLCDLIIVNSSAVRETLLESPWVDPSRVAVLLNSVSLEPVSREAGRRLVRSMGVPTEARVVCGVGRLTRQKGFDALIAAFALVRGRVPDARLVILGEGGQRGPLGEAAERAGVAEAVTFAGHREDVRKLLAGVDVYALSSRNEGMANTLLEAMSVGVPIVATDVSGTAEAVTDGVEALVVPPEDVAALANAIVRLLTEPALAASLGRAAFERARAQFGRERMTDELEGLFRRGISRKARVTARSRA